MNVAAIHFEIKPEKINELKSRWEPVQQEALKQKGLYKAILLTGAHGKCLAVGFWDSIENAKAFEKTSTYQGFLTAMKDIVVGTPERHVYSISGGDLSGIIDVKKAA